MDGAGHAFLHADSSIGALDTEGHVNYGNMQQFEASKDFIVISDRDQHSRDSPQGGKRHGRKLGLQGLGPELASILNVRAARRIDDSSSKWHSKKALIPPGGGGKFYNRLANPAMNISVDVKKTRTDLNRDLPGSTAQFKIADLARPAGGFI